MGEATGTVAEEEAMVTDVVVVDGGGEVEDPTMVEEDVAMAVETGTEVEAATEVEAVEAKTASPFPSSLAPRSTSNSVRACPSRAVDPCQSRVAGLCRGRFRDSSVPTFQGSNAVP